MTTARRLVATLGVIAALLAAPAPTEAAGHRKVPRSSTQVKQRGAERGGLLVGSKRKNPLVRATPAPEVRRTPRQVSKLTRAAIKQHLPTVGDAEARRRLSAGRWRPPRGWLEQDGADYGQVVIISDLHPSTGRDPVLREVSRAEDFLPDEQEVDIQNLFKTKWAEAVADGRKRTVVLNGDAHEFLQTDRAAVGRTSSGPEDEYGPLNTPNATVRKLEAIWAGHPGLFGAYAEHLARGHRLVLVPGNHDRQLIHPTVMRRFRQLLTSAVMAKLLADPAFGSGHGPRQRRKLARARARSRVADDFEFHPWFFVLGDLIVRHGNETDRHNNFSTPFGEHYHPGGKDAAIESALGDYVVKAIVSKSERGDTWIDHATRPWQVAKGILRAVGVTRLFGTFGYLLTREGADLSPDAVAKGKARLRRDVERYVREYDLVRKFNVVRPADQTLSHDGVVEFLLEYEAQAARSTLTRFDKRWGVLARLARLVWGVGQIAFGDKAGEVEQAMTDLLFGEYFSTVAVGHDHKFRLEQRLMVDGDGTVARGEVIDAASWTGRQRGVTVVDFDHRGSHPRLMYWDRLRDQLEMVSINERPANAATR